MRQEKTLLLNEIKEKIDSSTAFVVTRYKNLTPNLAAEFRLNVNKAGGSIEVVKKRILIKAAQDSGFTLNRDDLQGHIGVIFAEQDPVQTAKLVYKFKNENEGVLEILGGRFEGKLCSPKDVELISKLPSQDEMRSQLLSVFEAPMSQLLAVIEALLSSVIHCVDQKTDGSESGSEGSESGSEDGKSESEGSESGSDS